MNFEPEDQQVIELLTKLRNQGEAYPKKMLASRRQAYLGQIASIGAGLGIGAGAKTVTKVAKAGSTSFGSIVEMVLVVVIVAQSGIIAYKYRDKIIDLVNSLSPIITPTALSIPVTGSSLSESVVTETPLATDTVTETATITETPVGTDTSVTSGNGSSPAQNTAVAATPQPTKDVPGNHYGQTPKPPTQQKNDPKPTSANGNGGNNKKP